MKKTQQIFKTIAFTLVVLCLTNVESKAQVSNYKAYTLFLYNFTKYIQWPDGAIDQDFVIGVYGKSPITEELQKLGSIKKAGDKNIKIIELSETNLLQDVQILFIPEEKSAQIAAVLASVKGRPILVVSERQGLTQKGAAISFLTEQNNLRFELNTVSIASQNLKVSKALETLAFKKS